MINQKSCTCITAIAMTLLSTDAYAQSTIDNRVTAPQNTSSSGDITITEDGEIDIDSGIAITVDSNNDVNNDEGEITIGDADNARGISVNAGVDTDVVNDGVINITEDFDAEDDDSNGIITGPVANAQNRAGIFVEDGVTSGSIENSGSIVVEGLNSGGIIVNGTFNGDVTNSANISVLGDDSVGVSVNNVNGDVTLRGNITVVGEGAQAFVARGDIDGELLVQGNLQQSISFQNDGSSARLPSSSVRTDSATVEIAGNISQGIVFAVPPPNDDSNNDDEDGDGIEDNVEGSASVTSIGNGPAVLIGGASDTVIGVNNSIAGGYSIIVDGAILGDAEFSGTDGFGIVIGGRGGNVNVQGGINVNGTVNAVTVDSVATGILINSGSTVNRINNSGSITASLTTAGEGEIYAIRDFSGTLNTITNTGFISAVGTTEDVRQAISLANNTTGVTIIQELNDEDAETRMENEEDGEEDNTVFTAITGDIVTGSGDDLIRASAGRIDGLTFFNAGNDTLDLQGDVEYRGGVNFGAGSGTFNLSDEALFRGFLDASGQSVNLTINDQANFEGEIRDGQSLSVIVNGGTFGALNSDVQEFDTLEVGANGTISVFIDTEENENSRIVVNRAVFEDGSQISADITSIEDAEGSYTFLTSNDIVGVPEFDDSTVALPFIFSGEIEQSGNNLVLNIERRAADELGLTRAGSEAFDAIIDSIQTNDTFSDSFLEIDNSEDLQTQVDQFLPDHAGGIFEFASRSSRTITRHIMDSTSLYEDVSDYSVWLQPIFWRNSKQLTQTSDYEVRAFGISAGFERWSKLGYLGLSYSYVDGSIDNNIDEGESRNEIDAAQHEFSGFWRLDRGPLYAFARASGAFLSISGTRTFEGTANNNNIGTTANAEWDALLASASIGATYDLSAGKRVTFRPKAVIDYYSLNEDGYEETGGTDAFLLTVEDRDSDQISGLTSMSILYQIGEKNQNNIPLTLGLEGGRRFNLGGDLGSTVANFEDGDRFSITPDEIEDEWFGEAKLLAGGFDFSWQLVGRGFERDGEIGYSLRASMSIAF